jgi:hypothetical protein
VQTVASLSIFKALNRRRDTEGHGGGKRRAGTCHMPYSAAQSKTLGLAVRIRY